ncbi:MAG: hypothetical protein RhofKO_11350 [Rhodothermales bacterium]
MRTPAMTRLLIYLLPGLLLIACSSDDTADAYGNFEATEVTVSAEAQGRLLQFTVDAGDQLRPGDTVGLIDTTQLAAQRDGLLAQRRTLISRKRGLLAQRTASLAQTDEARAAAQALEVQLETAEEERDRTRRLFADQAATARELNEREGAVRALRAQLDQARARIGTARAQVDVPDAEARSLDDQMANIDAQLRQMDDRLNDATILNPEAGTVLAVLAEPGESVQMGSPLYTIADISTLKLRAYISGAQLPNLRLGQQVEVLVDDGAGGLATKAGQVVWIAQSAQFTPTPVQTRDARAELVYAFDVRVANPNGQLKIGMPGEVRFSGTEG